MPLFIKPRFWQDHTDFCKMSLLMIRTLISLESCLYKQLVLVAAFGVFGDNGVRTIYFYWFDILYLFNFFPWVFICHKSKINDIKGTSPKYIFFLLNKNYFDYCFLGVSQTFYIFVWIPCGKELLSTRFYFTMLNSEVVSLPEAHRCIYSSSSQT